MIDVYLGQILLVPYSYTPEGWLPCDGRLMNIQQNAELFSLLGTQFGGDGRTDFALPKVDPIATANGGTLQYIIATVGAYPSRA